MTNLNDCTTKIKFYCSSVKDNFIKIGTLLKQIRDEKIYIKKYNDFDDYLVSEGFNFHRAFADKVIKVVEDKKLLELSDKLGISKTIELLYVPKSFART